MMVLCLQKVLKSESPKDIDVHLEAFFVLEERNR
jgi:hypothetical protein